MKFQLLLFQAFTYLLLVFNCNSYAKPNNSSTPTGVVARESYPAPSKNYPLSLLPDQIYSKSGQVAPEYSESNIQSTFCLIGFITFASFILFVLHPLLTFPKRKRLSQGPPGPPPPPHYRKFPPGPPPKWTRVKVPIVHVSKPEPVWTTYGDDDDDDNSYTSYSSGSGTGSGWQFDSSSDATNDYYSTTTKAPRNIRPRPARPKETGSGKLIPRKPITGYSTNFKDQSNKGGGVSKDSEFTVTKAIDSGSTSTSGPSKEVENDKLTKEEIMYILKTLED